MKIKHRRHDFMHDGDKEAEEISDVVCNSFTINNYGTKESEKIRHEVKVMSKFLGRLTDTLTEKGLLDSEDLRKVLNFVFIEIVEEKKLKEDSDDFEDCPECGQHTVKVKGFEEGGGIGCTNPDCDYRFCY